MIHKFFGGATSIEGIAKLNKLGQTVELSDELAHDVREGGGAILPAEVYDSIGFTPEDEKLYPTPAHAKHAPAEHIEKRRKAFEILQAIRTGTYLAAVLAVEHQEEN